MSDLTSPPAPPPAAVLMNMVVGRWVAQAISAAAELGIADAIKDEPLTPDAIAARIGAHGPSAYRLLRALASLGIFREDDSGRFHQTPLSEPLRSDVPGSLRGWARFLGSRASLLAWGDLATSVRTGDPAFRRVFGTTFFEYLATAPAEAAAFDQAMHGVSSREIPAILEAFDFSDCGTIVDVGGGDGTLLAAILEKHQNVRGVLYDLDHVVARARDRLAGSAVAKRIDIVSGSFFDAAPPGGDTYLMKHILHDWSDEHCAPILRNVRRALPPHGRLLVVEAVVQPGNDPGFGKLLDLEMIALTEGGCERTEAAFVTLLAAAELRLARVVPTHAPTSVIEAVPA